MNDEIRCIVIKLHKKYDIPICILTELITQVTKSIHSQLLEVGEVKYRQKKTRRKVRQAEKRRR